MCHLTVLADTLKKVEKERDILRAAIIEYVQEDYFGFPHDPRTIKILIDALEKSRLEK